VTVPIFSRAAAKPMTYGVDVSLAERTLAEGGDRLQVVSTTNKEWLGTPFCLVQRSRATPALLAMGSGQYVAVREIEDEVVDKMIALVAESATAFRLVETPNLTEGLYVAHTDGETPQAFLVGSYVSHPPVLYARTGDNGEIVCAADHKTTPALLLAVYRDSDGKKKAKAERTLRKKGVIRTGATLKWYPSE